MTESLSNEEKTGESMEKPNISVMHFSNGFSAEKSRFKMSSATMSRFFSDTRIFPRIIPLL